MAEKSTEKRKIPWGLLYVAATVAALVLFGVFHREFADVFRVVKNLLPGFLAAALLTLTAYLLAEGFIILLLMRSQNVPMTFGGAVKLGLIGLYYSDITPSATGGQPMQAAYLLRENIPVGVSTAVLIMKFTCFQSGFFAVSLVSFLAMHTRLAAENPGIIPFILLGLVVNGGSILLLTSLFFRPVLEVVCRLGKWLAAKLRFLGRRREKLLAAVDRFHADFSLCSQVFRRKMGTVLLGALLSVPQFMLQMSVLYWVFRAFGYGGTSYWELLALQSLLQNSVSFTPLPGTSGAQELGFSAFFGAYFTRGDLYAALLVWRFFTYYLVVVAGALLVVADQFLYRRRKSRES